ncbi:hypothetical protein AYI69_g2371 [Smittium culicis]|uniref:Uncharacterized protein n=1 Tax=Smittium culicis TaxID=133412 RepID=A0A1R1YMM1_9FUNG|nr:hypothetical protein AYI69_g2371 [Smittium culicis]
MVKKQTKDSSNERTSSLPFEQISVSEDENSHARKEEYQTPQQIYEELSNCRVDVELWQSCGDVVAELWQSYSCVESELRQNC